MIVSEPITQKLLDELAARVRGPLLTAANEDYEAVRRVWNGMIDRHPAAVVRCLGVSDVVTCVNFARANNLELCIKGGGHNIAGLAVSDGALLLDMSLMRGVFAKHMAWARETWNALKPFSTGGMYLNFLTEEEGDERVRDALGSNYDRLIEVKTKWDPSNLFRTNKNIKPRE